MDELVEALRDQTRAIDELIRQNDKLIILMSQTEEQEGSQGDGKITLMNGETIDVQL